MASILEIHIHCKARTIAITHRKKYISQSPLHIGRFTKTRCNYCGGNRQQETERVHVHWMARNVTTFVECNGSGTETEAGLELFNVVEGMEKGRVGSVVYILL